MPFPRCGQLLGTHTRVTVLGVIPEMSSQGESCSFASGGDCCCGRNLCVLPLVYSAFLFCADSRRVLFAGSVESFRFRFPCQSLFPTDHAAVPAVWAVLGSMDGPGAGISASLAHFFSSLLPSACHGHQISSPGVFQPARSVSVMCSPFPPLCPHSFPALVFMVSQICFKSS